MDWSWAVGGITEEVPRTTGPECINYMTNRRRWLETVWFTIVFLLLIRWAVKRLDPILLPSSREIDKPHSAVRLMLLIAMTFVFGVEVGFKFSGRSVIFLMNPCHIQTVMQIYLLASRPSRTSIAIFRIQMNNLNGPFLAFLFPEVECRTLPFEQATYWIQHALLYIIPVYIIRTGAYKAEDITDFNWVIIGVMLMLLYHFVVLNTLSIYTGINLNHMLCAAVADPFQGQHYRIAAVIHESILCPILNKATVLIFRNSSTCSSNSCDGESSGNLKTIGQLMKSMTSKATSINPQLNANAGDGLVYHQQYGTSSAADMVLSDSKNAVLVHRCEHGAPRELQDDEEVGWDGKVSEFGQEMRTTLPFEYNAMSTTKLD